MALLGERGMGAITNDVLKVRKAIKFESSCIAICFSYVYLIIDGKIYFSIKKVVKNLSN